MTEITKDNWEEHYPIPNTEEALRKEFHNQFKITDDDTGAFLQYGEYSAGKSIADWWLSHLKEYKQEPHKTKDGWCCACGYDIAALDEVINDHEKEYKERVRKMIEGQHEYRHLELPDPLIRKLDLLSSDLLQWHYKEQKKRY